MTIGVFALLSAVGNKGQDGGRRDPGASRLSTVLPLPCTQLDDLRGLSRSQPAVALLLAICLFSLTGLPPTAGFLGKLNLFLAAWSDDSHIGHGLAIALAINAAISAWYYLRMVALMFLEPADPEADQARAIAVGAVVGGRCLRTRYNRNIRRAAVAVGQRSLVADAAEGLRLLLLLRQRIRLKSRLVSGGSSIPLHYQRRASFSLRTIRRIEGSRDGCCGMFAAAGFRSRSKPCDTTTHSFSLLVHEDFPPEFDLRGPFCDKAHSNLPSL